MLHYTGPVLGALTLIIFLNSGPTRAQESKLSEPGSVRQQSVKKPNDGKNSGVTTNSIESERKDTSDVVDNNITVEPGASSDPIFFLRQQIDAEDNGQEKGRLQLRLVETLVAQNRKPEAVKELHAMLAETHFDPTGLFNAGNALIRLGEADAAIRAYRKAIEQRKGGYSRALNNLGVVLMRQGLWQEADEALTNALRLENWRYAEASYNLGRLYAIRGEMDLATREWRRAILVDPKHREAAQALALPSSNNQIKISQPPAPREIPQTDKRQAATYNANKSTRISTPSRSLTVDPKSYSYLQRARNARERGKTEEAITNYLAVIKEMGGYFGPANLELSYVLIGQKRSEEALVYLREVTAREGARFPLSYYHLARIHEFKGNLGLALENYLQASKHFTGTNPQFLLDVSRVREKLGDFHGALTAFEQYVTAMEQLGSKPDWSEERLTALRRKATGGN